MHFSKKLIEINNWDSFLEEAAPDLVKKNKSNFLSKEIKKIIDHPGFKVLAAELGLSDISMGWYDSETNSFSIDFGLKALDIISITRKEKLEKNDILFKRLQLIIDAINNDKNEKDYLGLALSDFAAESSHLSIVLKIKELNFWGTFGKYAPGGNSPSREELIKH